MLGEQSPDLGPPQALFRSAGLTRASYAVSRDGARFLVPVQSEGSRTDVPLSVVQAHLRVADNLRRYGAASFACIHERRLVDRFASWNRLAGWLSLIGAMRAGTRTVKGTIMS